MRLETFLIVNMRLLIFMRLRVVKAIKLTMLFDPNVLGQKVSLMYSSREIPRVTTQNPGIHNYLIIFYHIRDDYLSVI